VIGQEQFAVGTHEQKVVVVFSGGLNLVLDPDGARALARALRRKATEAENGHDDGQLPMLLDPRVPNGATRN
jgi:hypothetical protein